MLDNLKQELGLLGRNKDVFHSLMHTKLKSQLCSINNNIARREDVLYSLSRHMKKECAEDFLKEMEGYGLIRFKNKQNIEIL